MKKRQQGFSLIELMIVVAIIGILAAVAAPAYNNYKRSAQFSEAIQVANSYKLKVMECIQDLGALSACDNGAGGLPAAVASGAFSANSTVDAISVTDGAITVTSTLTDAANNKVTIILTPNIVGGVYEWQKTGTCDDAGIDLC